MNTWNIANVKIANNIVIAPMAGVSDKAFRSLAYRFGAGLVYMEMVSDKAIVFKNEKTMAMCESDDLEHPLTAQLFGSDAESMVEAAIYLDENSKADIIDINMGCPVNKVIKTGAGSALLKDPDKAVKIASEIIKHVKKPVTVKMRLGFNKGDVVCFDLAKRLQEAGVKAIALHARFRSEMYEGKADWSYIKKMKEMLDIPLIGNGDIKSLDDFIAHKEDADALMIGRGVIGNPFLIKEITDYLEGKKQSEVSYQERLDLCIKHARDLMMLYGERNALAKMRGLSVHYITGLPYATKVKNDLNKIVTMQDLIDIFNKYQLFLDDYYCAGN